jgi:hypothetical protein
MGVQNAQREDREVKIAIAGCNCQEILHHPTNHCGLEPGNGLERSDFWIDVIPLGAPILRYRGEGLSRDLFTEPLSEKGLCFTRIKAFSLFFAIFLHVSLWKSQIQRVLHRNGLKPL